MSKHEDQICLQDMLNYASEAVELVSNVNHREEFGKDRVLQLALTRLIEIIGEAANRISFNTQQKHPEILWPQIIGMRNRLIHGYDVIDIDLLWDTVIDDLPPLIKALKKILNK